MTRRTLIAPLALLFISAFVTQPVQASTTLPSVGAVTPRTAVAGETITYNVAVRSDGLLSSCSLYIDDDRKKSMTVKFDVAYTTWKLSQAGVYDFHVVCTDADGNIVTGKTAKVTASAGSSYVSPGALIKLGCEGDIHPNDPCTAVYYYGVDGKRHAFPTQSVFSTWYDDFDDLVIVSRAVMSSIPLGKNATHRPGKRMVKFSTNTVYAVSYAGVLRPIANAQIAEALYGEDWTSLINIVDDVFYGNYRIGATVESSSSFSWSGARSSAKNISATF